MIVNDGIGYNKGDQAILISMLDSFNNAIPSAEIMAFPNSKLYSVGQYLQFYRALKKADLFIFGGGEEITDHYSVAGLINGLLKIMLAKILDRPIFCYALGVGSVKTGLGRLLTRLILNQVNLITVRDENSREQLSQLRVIKPPCFITADPAFTLIPSNEQQAQKIFLLEGIGDTDGPRIAITLCRWFHYQHYLLPMTWRLKFCRLQEQNDFACLKKTIAQVADHLISIHKAQVIFIPMSSPGGKTAPILNDAQVSKETMDLMKFKENVFILTGEYSPKELKAFLGQMDLVIGMRMHSLILTSMMNVPVIGIELSPKFHSFFELIGQIEYLLALNNINYRSLLEKIDKALSEREKVGDELKLRKRIIQELALSNITYAQEMLIK